MKLKMFVILCIAVLVLALPGICGSETFFKEALLKSCQFRNLGPYRAGSWITGFAVPETPDKAHLYTFYVGTRNGGVWKTENNGTTFTPLFDGQEMLSIGAIALAPSNPDIVWVGTGEAYNARSSHRGDGVYKSLDGGKTWQNMGLTDSHHIARIRVHPQNPDVVYVAAMGHLFSFNEERGLFKTTDGGKTWQKVLYIDEKVGVIDLVMHPKNPDILYAAAHEKYRYPWHFEESGPESGIYQTTDGGQTWARLGAGLPSGKIGRIGLDIYLKNPDILYAVVENANKRPPLEEEAKRDRENKKEPQERAIGAEVYRTGDGGKNWLKVNAVKDNVNSKAPYSFCQIWVDPNDEKNLFIISDTLVNSTDGGKTWYDLEWPNTRLFGRMFGDVRTLWIDPKNSDRILLGSDGGIHISYDGGKTCDFYDNLPLGEFYAVGVDMAEPYNIYGGMQDHDSWKGPSNGWSGVITLEDWMIVGGGDGMYNQVDPENNRWIYNCREFGEHYRVDQELGTRMNIFPKRPKDQPTYRWNWTPPILLCPHNSRIVYLGAQCLLRSLDQGEHWQEISPDLTWNDPVKTKGRGHIQYCTITTISESPVKPGVIWVGTDDGRVWVTRDAGASWGEATEKITALGAPAGFWVSRVLASRFEEGTAYVCKSGFRADDSRPFLFKTSDFGQTWTSISTGLPPSPLNVIVQDLRNNRLLFVGNDLGVYVTFDGGQEWLRLKNNLPSVPVKDLVIHPRENDLVVATYGRGLFVVDISPLQQVDERALKADMYFFQVEPKPQLITRNFGNYHLYGDRHIVVPNEPDGLVINYFLSKELKEKVKLVITDALGTEIDTLEGTAKAGMNRIIWPMTPKFTDADRERLRNARWEFAYLVEPGEYRVCLEIGKTKLVQKALITKRIGWSIGPSLRKL